MSEARRRLPEDLEQLAPGPELATLLASVDRRELSDKDRVRLVRARNRLVSHVNAELLADLYATTWDEPAAGAAVPAEAGQYPWAEAEVAYALAWTAMATGRRMEQARQLVEDLPQVLDALRVGVIDMPKALLIGELAGWLADRELARVVVDRVIGQASQLSTGQLRARLRRLVLAVDPQAAARRCAAVVKTRRVELFDNPEGTGELWGRSLPPQDTAAVWERLTAIARAAKSTGDPRSIDQLRADVLLDLLGGEGVAAGGPIGCHTGGLPGAEGLPEADLIAGEPIDGDRGSRHDHDRPDCRERLGRGSPGESDEPDGGGGVRPGVDPPAGATGEAGSGVGWDPRWPAEPSPEWTAAHEVFPDPVGEPVDRPDQAGEALDGADLRPPERPGRWLHDPAVTAAAAAAPPAAMDAPSCAAGPGPAPAGGAVTAGGGQPDAPAVLPGPRRGVVELQVPLTTLLRLGDQPGELAGFGPVVADIARQIAQQQTSATWRYSIYNTLGDLVHHGITHQRPTSDPPHPLPPEDFPPDPAAVTGDPPPR
jgi:hypothetical protein